MFAGLMSWCTMPALWIAASADATWMAMSSNSVVFGRPRTSRARSDSPSSRSMTTQVRPALVVRS